MILKVRIVMGETSFSKLRISLHCKMIHIFKALQIAYQESFDSDWDGAGSRMI